MTPEYLSTAIELAIETLMAELRPLFSKCDSEGQENWSFFAIFDNIAWSVLEERRVNVGIISQWPSAFQKAADWEFHGQIIADNNWKLWISITWKESNF